MNRSPAVERIPARFHLTPVEELEFGRSTLASSEPGLVSVIMPTFNRAATIGEAISSVASQSYRPLELIIVDDGSTDNTNQLVQEQSSSLGHSCRLRFKYVWQENRGAPSARNRGLVESRGQFVQYLDADDTMDRDRIEMQVAHAQSVGGRTLTYGPWLTRFNRAEGLATLQPGANIRSGCDPIAEYLEGRYIPVHGLLWTREALQEVGRWDETLKINEDGDMFLRAVARGWRLSYCARGAIYYHRSKRALNTVSSQRTKETYVSQVASLVRLQLLLDEKDLVTKYSHQLARFYMGRAVSLALLFPDVASDCLELSRNVAPHWARGRKWFCHALLKLTTLGLELDRSGSMRGILNTLHSLGRALRRVSLRRENTVRVALSPGNNEPRCLPASKRAQL